MIGVPEERSILIAQYILQNNATVREAGKVFGVSKSTVHKDVSHRLPKINPILYKQVKMVLDKNREERHLRGGQSTKEKYANM